MRFANLELVCRIWEQVALLYNSLARFFETAEPVWRDTIRSALDTLKVLDDEGYALLGDDFYPAIIDQKTYDAFEAERQRREKALGRNNRKKKTIEARPAPTAFRMGKSVPVSDDPYKQA
jgi:hypothetical protein